MRQIYKNTIISLITLSFVYTPMAFAKPNRVKSQTPTHAGLVKTIKKNRRGLKTSQVVESAKPMFKKRAYRDILKLTMPHWDKKIDNLVVGKDYFKLTIAGKTLFARYVDRGSVAFIVNKKPLLWKDFISYNRMKSRMTEILTGRKPAKKVSFIDRVLESFTFVTEADAKIKANCVGITNAQDKRSCEKLTPFDEDKFGIPIQELVTSHGKQVYCCEPTPIFDRKSMSCISRSGKTKRPPSTNSRKQTSVNPSQLKSSDKCRHGVHTTGRFKGQCKGDPSKKTTNTPYTPYKKECPHGAHTTGRFKGQCKADPNQKPSKDKECRHGVHTTGRFKGQCKADPKCKKPSKNPGKVPRITQDDICPTDAEDIEPPVVAPQTSEDECDPNAPVGDAADGSEKPCAAAGATGGGISPWMIGIGAVLLFLVLKNRNKKKKTTTTDPVTPDVPATDYGTEYNCPTPGARGLTQEYIDQHFPHCRTSNCEATNSCSDSSSSSSGTGSIDGGTFYPTGD